MFLEILSFSSFWSYSALILESPGSPQGSRLIKGPIFRFVKSLLNIVQKPGKPSKRRPAGIFRSHTIYVIDTKLFADSRHNQDESSRKMIYARTCFSRNLSRFRSEPLFGKDYVRSSIGGSSACGSSNQKRVPRPGVLSTWIFSPWACRICLTILSPRPVPPLFRDRSGSTR